MSNNKALDVETAPKLFHVVPSNEYCHSPSLAVDASPVIAMPANESLSPSANFDENSDVTVAPAGDNVSSLTAVKAAFADKVGASITAVTSILDVTE